MSFASDIKEEIARNELSDNLQRAQLSALIQLLATMGFSSEGLNLKIKCSNAVVTKRIASNIANLYQVRPDIMAVKQTKLSQGNVYYLTVNEKVKDILYDLDLWVEKGFLEHPRLSFLNNDEMIKAYLGGCFMASGSINSPQTTQYHLELTANSQSHGNFLLKLLEKCYINAKMTERREKFIVYVKSGEQIADFLKAIGAVDAVIEFEDVRIQRDFFNQLHRLDNVKIANEQKSQKVADAQIEAINYLAQRDLLKYLSEKEQHIAKLRLADPFASLNELAESYYEETGILLSKSGIRHRFEKIFALADKYKKKEEGINE